MSGELSGELPGAPLFTAQAVRYAAACLLLLAVARLTRRRIAATGLVVFNLALVEGSRHAEPAVLGVAVACVPLVLAVVAPLMDGRRPRPAVLLAALVVTCGAGLVQGIGRSDPSGLAWAAIVLACEAGFTLPAVPVLRRHGPWGVSVHTTWPATVIFAGIGLVHEGPAAVSRLTAPDLTAIGYLATGVTASPP